MPDPTPLAWPAGLGWGTITGRFVYLDGDSDDEGDEPDLIPAAGGTVEIEPNAPLAAYLDETNPMTTVARRVTGIIDAQGYLCRKTASGMPGARGLPLVATDADLSTKGFNYKVTVKLVDATIPTMNISVLSGQTVDITTAITESVSTGTKVVSLTPEIRAEIARAVASVSIESGGLVTEDAFATALAGKLDRGEADAALADRVTRREAEEIALENALLNEDQPLTKVVVRDGLLVLVRRDGVELTVEGSIGAPSTGSGSAVSITRQLAWSDVSMPCDYGWVHRDGNRVLLCLVNPRMSQGQAVWTPPAGWRVGRIADSSTFLSAQVTEYGGTVRATQQSAHMYETTIYADAKIGSATPAEPDQVSKLVVEWITFDAPDTSGTLGTDPFAGGQG